MIFNRAIEKKIRPWIIRKEIIVITGMRRVGKTTLLKKIHDSLESENKVFLDFENLLDRRVFRETDYNNILKNLKPYGINPDLPSFIFIDEIQLQPESVSAIKYLYDHLKVKFFITGSSSFYLKNMFPESLSGRKALFELFPLSFDEYLVFKGIKRDYHETFSEKHDNKNKIKHEKLVKEFDEYMYFGGFPQVVLNETEDHKKEILSDIFRSYYQKDIQLLADFRNMQAFEELVLLLMQRAGSRLDISKLASTVNVSRETIYNYLAFLEGTYFIDLIRPFSRNVDREISGSRKVYICDTGLINVFAKVDAGSMFENAVYNNLKLLGGINYYQKRSGAEIDFILQQKGIALECKICGTQQELKSLRKTTEGLGLDKSYIISQKFHQEEGFLPVIEL